MILNVPRGVTVRKVDLAVELQILSFYQRRSSAGLSAVLEEAGPGQPASA
jgi:hypothetical protein